MIVYFNYTTFASLASIHRILSFDRLRFIDRTGWQNKDECYDRSRNECQRVIFEGSDIDKISRVRNTEIMHSICEDLEIEFK